MYPGVQGEGKGDRSQTGSRYVVGNNGRLCLQRAYNGDGRKLITYVICAAAERVSACMHAPKHITGIKSKRYIALSFKMKPSKCHFKPPRPGRVKGCLYPKPSITPVP